MQISISIILLVSILLKITYGDMSLEDYIASSNPCFSCGFEYGTSVLMEQFSPISCRPSIESDYQTGLRALNGIICFCSDFDDRYDVDEQFCMYLQSR